MFAVDMAAVAAIIVVIFFLFRKSISKYFPISSIINKLKIFFSLLFSLFMAYSIYVMFGIDVFLRFFARVLNLLLSFVNFFVKKIDNQKEILSNLLDFHLHRSARLVRELFEK